MKSWRFLLVFTGAIVLAGGAEWDPGGAQCDLLRFAEREHVRVIRRQDLHYYIRPAFIFSFNSSIQRRWKSS